MKRITLILISLPLTSVFASECKTDETLIASCNLSGKVSRSAFFCVSKTSDLIRYTFERDHKPELVVNFNPKDKLKRWLDLGTYSTYLGFKKSTYSYVLIIPEERPEAVALMDVSRNGRRISRSRCNANSFGKKDIKSNSIVSKMYLTQ